MSGESITFASPFEGLRTGDVITINGELRVVTGVIGATCIGVGPATLWQRFAFWWTNTALPIIWSWNPCNVEGERA